jgi:hypothetical protein
VEYSLGCVHRQVFSLLFSEDRERRVRMTSRRAILVFAAAILLSAPPVVRGDDLADLQTTFGKDIRLLNGGNKDAFSASAHEEVVLFGILSPFAIKGKEAVRQLIQQYLDDHARVNFKAVNPEFVLTGTDALAWGHYTILEDPKTGPRETIHGRYTLAYTKVDGQWLLAAFHLSPLQSYSPAPAR